MPYCRSGRATSRRGSRRRGCCWVEKCGRQTRPPRRREAVKGRWRERRQRITCSAWLWPDSSDFSGAEGAFTEVARINPRAAAAQTATRSGIRLARGESRAALHGCRSRGACSTRRRRECRSAEPKSHGHRSGPTARHGSNRRMAQPRTRCRFRWRNGWVALERSDMRAARAAFTRVLANEPRCPSMPEKRTRRRRLWLSETPRSRKWLTLPAGATRPRRDRRLRLLAGAGRDRRR